MTTSTDPDRLRLRRRDHRRDVARRHRPHRPPRRRHRRLLRASASRRPAPSPRPAPTASSPPAGPSAAPEALDGIDGVEVDALDLGDLDSVAAFAERFLASGRAIDMLIDNAGIMATPETRVGPGWEPQFATNHLGHFALVNRLWPRSRGRRRARRLGLLARPPLLPGAARRPRTSSAGLRQVAGLRAVEDRERPLRRRARRARPRPRRPRLRAAPRRDHDAAAAPPPARGDGRAGLDRRGRQPARTAASRPPSRARPPRSGPRRRRSSTAAAGSTSRTARSPEVPEDGPGRACGPTRSTPTRRSGSGRSRPSSPA